MIYFVGLSSEISFLHEFSQLFHQQSIFRRAWTFHHCQRIFLCLISFSRISNRYIPNDENKAQLKTSMPDNKKFCLISSAVINSSHRKMMLFKVEDFDVVSCESVSRSELVDLQSHSSIRPLYDSLNFDDSFLLLIMFLWKRSWKNGCVLLSLIFFKTFDLLLMQQFIHSTHHSSHTRFKKELSLSLRQIFQIFSDFLRSRS